LQDERFSVGEDDAQGADMAAGIAIEEAAGAAGVGGDGASDGGAVFGGIGAVELFRGRGGGLNGSERGTGSADGVA